jgi:hypothetical protein
VVGIDRKVINMWILGLCLIGLVYLVFVVAILVLFVIPSRIEICEGKMTKKIEWQKPTLVELSKAESISNGCADCLQGFNASGALKCYKGIGVK